MAVEAIESTVAQSEGLQEPSALTESQVAGGVDPDVFDGSAPFPESRDRGQTSQERMARSLAIEAQGVNEGVR